MDSAHSTRKMAHTPESVIRRQSLKDLQYFREAFDSGYSDSFDSPKKDHLGKYKSPSLFSSDELDETPKENLSLQRQAMDSMLVTPKDRTRVSERLLDKDLRRERQPPPGGWCETPKVSKKDSSLRRRLLMSKSATDVKTETSKTSSVAKVESSLPARSKPCFNTSFDSPENVLVGGLATSTLKPDDVLLSGRKRRLFLSQMRTSTLAEGKQCAGDLSDFEGKESLLDVDLLNESVIPTDQLTSQMLETPRQSRFHPSLTKGISQSPASGNLRESQSILRTPSSTPTHKYHRSVSEDSGFGSLALDKSQDSSVDHDGSFQELLQPSSAFRGNEDTPQQVEVRRHSRLARQRRLSTLREGGSQSEEDNKNVGATCKHRNLSDRENQHFQKDQKPLPEVFSIDGDSPLRGPVANLNNMTHRSAKRDAVTPPWMCTSKLESVTPIAAIPGVHDKSTPPRLTDMKLDDLSLTPALQLVHAMCLRSARMLSEQSPSMEALLRSASVMAKTPETFRTSMPLAGLIGRKMGLDKVDVLTELKKRNLRHILAVVLNHLSSEDIYSFGQVCQSWNEIVQQDKHASFRRRLYQKKMKALELSCAVHVPDAETRLALSCRSALKFVQLQSKTASYCTPQSDKGTLTPTQSSTLLSGSSSSKRDKFIQVAKTLFKDECLKPCPRCQHPARYQAVKREALCTRPDCSFQFCTDCLCAYHGSKECGSRSSGRSSSKKDILLPGSAKSKRNVRRL